MNIKMSGKNVKLTDGMKSAMQDSISKIDKYFADEPEVNVICSTDAGLHRVEITVTYKKKIIRSEVTSNDMYVSFDTAVENLERKIQKYKTKLSKDMKETVVLDIEDIFPEPVISIEKVKHYDLKPMYPEDACLHLELLGHNFFAFVNAETDEVCIVYKRKSGYGMMTPER